MNFRHNEKNDSAGPGPGQYNITGLSAKGQLNLYVIFFFNIVFVINMKDKI